MRGRLLLLALLAGCAAPKPCTRALCVERLDGTLVTSAWSGTVTSTASEPTPPVPPDSEVTVRYGSAEFRHGRQTLVAAGEGASFRFTVSTGAAASISVSSGPVAVSVSSGAAPVPVAPGTTFVLPKPR